MVAKHSKVKNALNVYEGREQARKSLIIRDRLVELGCVDILQLNRKEREVRKEIKEISSNLCVKKVPTK